MCWKRRFTNWTGPVRRLNFGSAQLDSDGFALLQEPSRCCRARCPFFPLPIHLGRSKGTAAFTVDGGRHWTASTKPPHGYRSSVAYYEEAKIWIAVGPNGTDVSTDDGRNWRALLPDTAIQEPADADRGLI